MNLLKRLFIAAAVALIPLAGQAATPSGALSPSDQAVVDRVLQYLNSIHTMEARFVQIAPDGREAAGTFFLSRPGKLRVQYDPPNPMLVIASGIYLTVYDPELKQTSYLPLKATPAYFLVQDQLSLGKDIAVSKVERGPGAIRITVHEAGHPETGLLTLVFSDSPLQLQKWTVIDRDGQPIQVALQNARYGDVLNPELFKFVDPSASIRDTH